MTRLMQIICDAIEESHGRLSPTVHDYQAYERNKQRIQQQINSDRHLDEKLGSSFVHVIDHKAIQKAIDGDLEALGGSAAELVVTNEPETIDDVSMPADGVAATKVGGATKPRRDSLDSISSMSDVSVKSLDSLPGSKRKSRRVADDDDDDDAMHETIDLRSNSRSVSPKAKQIMPSPKELAQQSTEISKERYKWEKYR